MYKNVMNGTIFTVNAEIFFAPPNTVNIVAIHKIIPVAILGYPITSKKHSDITFACIIPPRKSEHIMQSIANSGAKIFPKCLP